MLMDITQLIYIFFLIITIFMATKIQYNILGLAAASGGHVVSTDDRDTDGP
jgi:hypothetical protein